MQVGTQAPSDNHFHINNNIHSGDSFNGPWLAGPFEIGDGDRVGASFVIENKSHTDSAKQESEVIQVGAVIAAGIFGVMSAEASAVKFNSESVADAVAGAVVAAAGTIWATLVGDSDPDCNGEVLTRALAFDRGDLQKEGSQAFDDPERTGPSKDNCGDPPRTKVKYSVHLWTLREALRTFGFDLSHTVNVRSIQPQVSNVRSFMRFGK